MILGANSALVELPSEPHHTKVESLFLAYVHVNHYGNVSPPNTPLKPPILAHSPSTSTDRLPRSTYYDKHYRQTAALIRARQPYLIRNIFTGLGLTVFTISVCR